MRARMLLAAVAPRAYDYGGGECNDLGKKLIARRGGSMLDLGCGDGSLTLEFARAAGAERVYGIEFADGPCEVAASKGIECVKGDLNLGWEFPDGMFDLVLSSQNIEHVYNTRLYLCECFRCLKPGGQLLVLTENLSSWPNICSLALGWQPFSATNIDGWRLGNPMIWDLGDVRHRIAEDQAMEAGASGVIGHVRVLAYRGLRDVITKAGFSSVLVLSTGYPPFWGQMADFMCRIDKRHGHFLVATGFKRAR